MSSYIFPGYPAFLESASAELGLPKSAAPAGRIVPLTDLANLCAQASHGDPAYIKGIIAKAAEFRDHLAVALRAAELMLSEVAAARCPPEHEHRVEVAASALQTTSPNARKTRKGPTTSRESS